MNLYKTGYIVAIIDIDKEFSYRPWPLEEFCNNAEAEKLTNEGDDRWFIKYEDEFMRVLIDNMKKFMEISDFYCIEGNL